MTQTIVVEAPGAISIAKATEDSAEALQAVGDLKQSRPELATVTALLADTSLTYTAGQPGTVVAGQIVRTRAEGFSYEVAASAATDHHVTTAGGVKLYVLPGDEGSVSVKAFGATGNGAADDTTAVLAAFASPFKHIHFPQGSYLLTQCIDVIGDNRKVSGAGIYSTFIRVDHADGGFRFMSTRQVLLSIRIICSHAAGSAFAISVNQTYFTAKDVFTDWGGVGRFVNGAIVPASGAAWVKYFENCLFSTTSGDAFLVEANSFNHVVFVACTFRGALEHGFHLRGGSSHGVSFHGCRAENNGLHGFRIAGRRGNQVSWHNVYLENNGGVGIQLGYTAPAWSADTDYMEACHISGLSAWRLGSAAVQAEKCIGVTLQGVTVGADTTGFYSNGAIRPAWGNYPLQGPQIKVLDIARRGSATDYALIFDSGNVMVMSGEGRDATYDQGWGPSANITRIGTIGSRFGFGVTGAFASSGVTLGRRASLSSTGVSAFAATGGALGPSATGAVIASKDIDLDSVPENSSLNAVIGSDLSSFKTSDAGFRQVVLASQRVKSESNAAVCGGTASSGDALSSNRKWEISSFTGNITIAGAVTAGHTFADFAEMFENAEAGVIPLGTIVTEKAGKVSPAGKSDDIAGVVTATAVITAGDTPFAWAGRYLVDEWGREILQEIPNPDWDGEGDAPLVMLPVESPDWNPESPQVSRSDRPDAWTRVGLLGQVFTRVAKDVAAGDRLAAVDGIGVKSKARTGLRCMKITQPYDAEKGYAVARCLINVQV